ncbi:ATP-dependent nuclease [Enterobacter roggenkampii]|uniref:ATP-dependent nuclease n=1 Tax=Enterobacter roggenkampii TaxID=1812935 RepID=UPI001C854B88|nr:AAA family ATPase [Enterobacter roggenkampii]
MAELERLVAEVNKEAIEKSEPLKRLKTHLDNMNQSFEGSGQTELTPFPKKIRDLSKRFSVNFGETDKSSFSMEYHGMGTRSWASMLTVKAFTELLAKNHEEEAEPFFPVMAAEEPEAHLHPNAQRTLYRQLVDVPGQVIISTHSPYIAGLAELHEIRSLSKRKNSVQVYQLRDEFEDDDLRRLKREVVHSRGELLFSKAIVLSEGETEEQALPSYLERMLESIPSHLELILLVSMAQGQNIVHSSFWRKTLTFQSLYLVMESLKRLKISRKIMKKFSELLISRKPIISQYLTGLILRDIY